MVRNMLTLALPVRYKAEVCMVEKVDLHNVRAMCGSIGGTGGPDPLKNHKHIGRFRSNSGPDPLKNYEATKLAFNVGPSSARQRNAQGAQ